jgi:hypothetical protein
MHRIVKERVMIRHCVSLVFGVLSFAELTIIHQHQETI